MQLLILNSLDDNFKLRAHFDAHLGKF